ncbi:poly [ADP-ribose] polymerase 2-A isoform X3 [Juglans microcarpa x Juglans regia]|uniref:poly [ADP-ribose] polymerase 2-A isoform X3 n=1 Tax=Juglans microcarpa x Juglans regia TaxID=2249226 RepID=UPI001B7E6ADA|nr:poly [ADP-ribose] polymerase 2-A isoform X3 [Juglans microcarpa x Juglans regia]
MRFLQFARPLKSQGSRHLSLSLSLCKMANQLKVEELRTQLAQRCLSTTGTKPTLVRRLEAALRKEKKQQTTGTDGDASTNKKRQRDSENGDSSVPGKIKAIEKLRGMGIRQLRELAAHRGVSETGSKKEILERLCEDSDDQDLQEIPQGKSSQEENESKNEKIVTVTKKGAAVLDQWLPDHIKAHYHVLQLGDEIYDAMLNQTNVGDNNNKFYVIQVLGYNADKLPLGKLSKSTILKGYDVLKRIADVIGKSNRKKLEELSGEFYTVIPHDFGFRKMREFVIDSPQKLKHKLEMVEALAEIEVATKLLKDDTGIEDDPLYSHYRRLHCELTPIGVDSKEFHMIAKYMQNTHAKSHSNYDVDIVQIFRVSREGEPERFKKFSSTKNRMLLWHGSRLTNWTGILSQGLRIAPPEAPVTGYMFGKGVYFADMFSKSANYCYATHAAKPGVLLLCEVALGDMAELLNAKYDADKLPEGKLSTKGVGGTAPDLSEAHALEDGVVVPLGKPKEQLGHQGALLYNEYIVYNVDQIRMRYVIQVNFNFM